MNYNNYYSALIRFRKDVINPEEAVQKAYESAVECIDELRLYETRLSHRVDRMANVLGDRQGGIRALLTLHDGARAAHMQVIEALRALQAALDDRSESETEPEKTLRRIADGAYARLSERERELLRKRFDVHGERPNTDDIDTLNERPEGKVAPSEGIPDKVREIEDDAIERLRNPRREHPRNPSPRIAGVLLRTFSTTAATDALRNLEAESADTVTDAINALLPVTYRLYRPTNPFEVWRPENISMWCCYCGMYSRDRSLEGHTCRRPERTMDDPRPIREAHEKEEKTRLVLALANLGTHLDPAVVVTRGFAHNDSHAPIAIGNHGLSWCFGCASTFSGIEHKCRTPFL